jgi:hypothetical protein
MTSKERRAKRLKKLFNLDAGDYERIVTHQGGVCAICRKPPKTKPLAVDHCHTTGLTRGAACNMCNRALAAFRDNPELLKAAAEYLENPPATKALGAPRYGLRGRVTNNAKTRDRLNPELKK